MAESDSTGEQISCSKNAAGKSVCVRPMTVVEIAAVADLPVSEVILHLLRKGIASTRNQILGESVVEETLTFFGCQAVRSKSDVAGQVTDELLEKKGFVAGEKGVETRAPIIVVVGHVDHGKTTLLDYIRKTRVALREKGGITQHLGAYEVETSHGKIIFLDTPGHEAFAMMRSRGIRVADLVVLVVAADDGVMPQTVEAIKRAKEAQVPIIVALNKIDRADEKSIENVKTQLSKHDVLVEDWGGDVICVPISAKSGAGVDQLLDMLALQAQMLDLHTKKTGAGVGCVLESSMERGRGAVGTVILQYGVLEIGDYFLVGDTKGRVSSLMDSSGKWVKHVGPTVPISVAGFDELPQAGDIFTVVSAVRYKKAREQKSDVSLVLSQVLVQSSEAVKIILKADTDSSKEALIAALGKIGAQEKQPIVIISAGVGPITEGDLDLAVTADARLYTFGVKPDATVQAYAKRLNRTIYSFDIIYHLLDDVRAFIKSLREPEKVLTKTGEAIVLKVFDIKGVGVIAGCSVKKGKIVKNGHVVVWRGNQKIGEGDIQTLQRDKRSMKEVAAGFECAFIVSGLSDFQEDDRVECFVQEFVKKD